MKKHSIFVRQTARVVGHLRRLAAAILRLLMRTISFALAYLGFRFLRVPCVDRIGHLALDIDSYLKENMLLKRRVRPIYLLGEAGSSRSDVPANPALMRYWSQYIYTVGPGRLWRFLAAVRDRFGPVDDLADYAFNITTSARAYEIQGKWNGRAPLLSLTATDRQRGQEVVREMGLPDDAWFVCLHARESGYSPADEHYHSYRNVDIASYEKAIADIRARGGWCIRMGDPSMRSIKPTAGVIDYALSRFKSDWMDIYLCATCRFFLGDNSGLFSLAGCFGTVAALTNTTPLSCGYSAYCGHLSIPKQMLRHGRVMTLAECLSNEVGRLRLTWEFEQADISFVNNSSDEIAALVREVFDRLDGTAVYTTEDELLQERMRALIKPSQCCWQTSSRIGRDYLRSRADELLDLPAVADATRAANVFHQ
jgi:putative glycosyltransferase (TIGR04372 family)